MTVWDYLDRHELLGPCVLLVLAVGVVRLLEGALVAWARAWGARKR